MATSNAPRIGEPGTTCAGQVQAPGPFRADQLRDGDRYELSNGHPVRCAPAGPRHGRTNLDGGMVLRTDPAVQSAGVDVGIAWNEGKNLRAPDVVLVTDEDQRSGWMKTIPPLVVEYADKGQDEEELQDKIAELLNAGVQYIWVIRLVGPLRVEVYEPGKSVRTVGEGGVLAAPGVLENSYQVRDLVDPDAALDATLHNILRRKGLRSLEEVEQRGMGQGAQRALLDVLAARGIPIPEEVRTLIVRTTDLDALHRWLITAATANSLRDVFPG